uniref:Uncharacterized protein n=1 Tax=Cyprinus carpio TaxID=7962 RepID=A0A8C2DKF4_CYPCA
MFQINVTLYCCCSSFRTQTLASCISKTPSTAERKEFIFDFIKTFIEADIPLEKTSKLPAILQKYCKQGGSVPAPSHLRSLPTTIISSVFGGYQAGCTWKSCICNC